MKSKTSIIKKVFYIIIPLVLIAFVVFKLKTNKEISTKKVYHYDKEEAITIQVDTLKFENITHNTAYLGTFEPNKESKISTESQGKVNEVLVDVGSEVKKGQLLIRLDNSLLKLQLNTIEVQIEGLEADVNRYTILSKTDAIQGIQLEKAVLGLKVAQTQKAVLAEQINKSLIKAPFDGIITAKFTEEGSFAVPSMPLLQLTDINNLRFAIQVTEGNIKLFEINQPYSISVDAYPTLALTGKTILIGSKANVANSFLIQFGISNTKDLKVKSGMLGKIKLNRENNEQQKQGISIPSSALIGSAPDYQVYLVKNGKTVLQNVSISEVTENKVIVVNGVKENDILVTNGFINLFEGANVIIK